MVWWLGDQIPFHQLTRKTRRVLTPGKKVIAKITPVHFVQPRPE